MQLCDRAKNTMNRKRRGLKEDVDVEINEKMRRRREKTAAKFISDEIECVLKRSVKNKRTYIKIDESK